MSNKEIKRFAISYSIEKWHSVKAVCNGLSKMGLTPLIHGCLMKGGVASRHYLHVRRKDGTEETQTLSAWKTELWFYKQSLKGDNQ